MTEAEIQWRLKRVNAAFEDKSKFKPEDVPLEIRQDSRSFGFVQDFTGGRSQENLDADAASIINEIMGIRDRAKTWLKNKGEDPTKVDDFVKSELSVSIVHDLANTDKHGQLDRKPFSGYRPSPTNVSRVMALKYDPATRTYPSSGFYQGPGFNMQTGEVFPGQTSSGMEIVLDGDVVDESGNEVADLKRVLPDAIYMWEQFLRSVGLTFP